LPRSERILFWSLAAAALVLRALAFFRYRFDSDEQQHLHVAWGWTAGHLQYRDLFDNHAPLFHMLTAPLLALLGERSDVLLWMRAPMLLLFGAVLWATYVLGRRLYDERVGAGAVVLLALFPPYFLKSLEYRNDNLWTALWMLALVVVTKRPLTPSRWFAAGLILGCALATSVKTGPVMIALAIAAAVSDVLVNRQRRITAALPALAGFVVVPAIVAAFFASAGALDDLYFCNFTFNANMALTRPYLWIGRALFPFAFATVLWAAWRSRDTSHPWRYFYAMVMAVYAVVLGGFWILISPRDFLPLMPLAAIFTAAVVTRARRPVVAFASIAAVMMLGLWRYADRFENKTDWHTTMMDQALRLSHPGEPLIDLKGETIYRRRPFYFVFENITRAQMNKGIIRDTVAADVIRTRTHDAQADGPMWPPQARAFLSENFLDMGRLRASGQWIKEDGSFTIAVPGEYVVLSEMGEARGSLDGTLSNGARELAQGAHHFVRLVPGEKIAVVWAPAVRRGHSPFHLRDREF
jgi:hypothetical protein